MVITAGYVAELDQMKNSLEEAMQTIFVEIAGSKKGGKQEKREKEKKS